MKTAQYKFERASLTMYLAANEKGVRGIWWHKPNGTFVSSLNGDAPEIKMLAKAAKQLAEYFDGSRTSFDLPLDVEGTDFQKSVWNELKKIPYGETASYRDIAQRLKNAKAVRAVGTANGKNPISIVVPCHRVIQANGSLGGYAGGLDAKAKLLELEKKS